jgi:diguanylate cyclase (GGDEF)-like protein/PAS domain S-box-containing protein
VKKHTVKKRDKTKKQLTPELGKLQQRVAELEAPEDERKQAEKVLKASETRYRRLFESAQDGILLLEADTGKIIDVNPFMTEILGYAREEFLGKQLWEIGLFEDITANKIVFGRLQREKYIRYEHLPLRAKDGKHRDVEFVSNVYMDNDTEVIQCNIRDITDRKRHERQQVLIGTHDGLTGLPNRVLFEDLLSIALNQTLRSQQKLAVMLLDLDHFKEINDTLGHDVGDKLLLAVGDRLSGLLRKMDAIARMGGDEFLLLLPLIDREKYVVTIAQKIIGAFHKPFVLDAHEILITTSIGVVIAHDDGEDADTLVKKADIAMYHAKKQGRDNYQRYISAMTEKDS